MVKQMGLGIACLTLVLSGVTRAVEIKTDKGNCGKYDDHSYKHDKECDDKGDGCKTLDLCIDIKKECEKIDKDFCKDIKNLKDCKEDKNWKHDKKDEKSCKIDWKKHYKHDICEDKHDDRCDYGKDRCHDKGCEPVHCDPVTVPTPASSAMGGAGIAGIILMSIARARRTIKA
ncbi:MAG TPA: hypothetical protein VGG44_10385 [Tepidisphaeraceae bacterium]|jgi:hypothetical protein